MSRNERIKLYKKIWNKYYGGAEKLPQDEKNEALAANYLVNAYEIFSSHNEALHTAKQRISTIEETEIAEAYLYSLSTSLCEYRSPLFSYYYIKSVEPHEYDNSFFNSGKKYHSAYCRICGYNDYTEHSFDWQFGSLNYGLIRLYLFGAVMRMTPDLNSGIMDITNYLSLPKVKATKYDKQIFIRALDLIKQLAPSDKAGAYIKLLYNSKIIPNSSKGQITAFVDMLGNLNILHGKGDYSIIKGKDKYDKTYRDPIEHKNDHPFPLTHWKASDGIDMEEVKAIFNLDL